MRNNIKIKHVKTPHSKLQCTKRKHVSVLIILNSFYNVTNPEHAKKLIHTKISLTLNEIYGTWDACFRLIIPKLTLYSKVNYTLRLNRDILRF